MGHWACPESLSATDIPVPTRTLMPPRGRYSTATSPLMNPTVPNSFAVRIRRPGGEAHAAARLVEEVEAARGVRGEARVPVAHVVLAERDVDAAELAEPLAHLDADQRAPEQLRREVETDGRRSPARRGRRRPGLRDRGSRLFGVEGLRTGPVPRVARVAPRGEGDGDDDCGDGDGGLHAPVQTQPRCQTPRGGDPARSAAIVAGDPGPPFIS